MQFDFYDKYFINVIIPLYSLNNDTPQKDSLEIVSLVATKGLFPNQFVADIDRILSTI